MLYIENINLALMAHHPKILSLIIYDHRLIFKIWSHHLFSYYDVVYNELKCYLCGQLDGHCC